MTETVADDSSNDFERIRALASQAIEQAKEICEAARENRWRWQTELERSRLLGPEGRAFAEPATGDRARTTPT